MIRFFACWLIVLGSALWANMACADSSVWKPVPADAYRSEVLEPELKHQFFSVEPDMLKELLIEAFLTKQPISLPMPEEGMVEVRLVYSAVFAQGETDQYPDIYTWKIISDDGSVSGRAELTSQGFKAVLFGVANGSDVTIEPIGGRSGVQSDSVYLSTQSSGGHFLSGNFQCGVLGGANAVQSFQRSSFQELRKVSENNGNIYVLRLAVAATAEFVELSGGQMQAFETISSMINRVNVIYERDLGVRFSLVSGLDSIFLDAETDGYTNGDLLNMVKENEGRLSAVYESLDYDVGHVIGYKEEPSGVAWVRSVCGDNKAAGVTLISDPEKDIAGYFAHELGHQLGASHTLNSSDSMCGGARSFLPSSAFEVGSGNTVMGYAGLCEIDNVQASADSQFHAASIDQIGQTLDGLVDNAACGLFEQSSNSLPEVLIAAGKTIPARTPFILNGSASDVDGDQLLYGWDQVDLGLSSLMSEDFETNALIKSNLLSSNPVRYVPDFLTSGLVSLNAGEYLPATTRELNFRLVVRDGKGGVSYGDQKLDIHNTGRPFSIIYPGGGLPAGWHIVAWDVAETTEAPISCSSVDISYYLDGEGEFVDLKRNTPNDGFEYIFLDKKIERLRVKCSDNVFFAISGYEPRIANQEYDVPVEDVPVEDVPVEDVPVEDVPVEDVPVEDISGGGSMDFFLLLVLLLFFWRYYPDRGSAL